MSDTPRQDAEMPWSTLERELASERLAHNQTRLELARLKETWAELRILKAADYEALTGGADYGLIKLENARLQVELESQKRLWRQIAEREKLQAENESLNLKSETINGGENRGPTCREYRLAIGDDQGKAMGIPMTDELLDEWLAHDQSGIELARLKAENESLRAQNRPLPISDIILPAPELNAFSFKIKRPG